MHHYPSERRRRDSPGQDIKSLYLQISKCSSKPAILSIVPPHMLRIMLPKARDLPNFPKPLQSLYQSSFYQLNYVELFSSTCSVEAHDQLSLTTEMVDTVEKETQVLRIKVIPNCAIGIMQGSLIKSI